MILKKIIAGMSAFSVMACCSLDVLNANAYITYTNEKEITDTEIVTAWL